MGRKELFFDESEALAVLELIRDYCKVGDDSPKDVRAVIARLLDESITTIEYYKSDTKAME